MHPSIPWGRGGDSRGSKGKDFSPEYCTYIGRDLKGARASGYHQCRQVLGSYSWLGGQLMKTQIPLPEAAGAPRILLPTTALPLESLLSLERKESELQTDFLAASPSPLQPLLGCRLPGKAERVGRPPTQTPENRVQEMRGLTVHEQSLL